MPPGFSGRPFWASPMCTPQPLRSPCSAPSAPQQQDRPAWFGHEAVRVRCATALSWAARLQDPVLCSLPCSRPTAPGHPDRSLLARLDAVPPAPRGRAQPSLPTPALHSFPPGPCPSQLSSHCSCGPAPRGQALGMRSRWAVEGLSQRGRVCSEGSERPRGGVSGLGVPPPKDHVAKWPPAPFTRTGCLCAHVEPWF